MNTLTIDTTESKIIRISLEKGLEKFDAKKEFDKPHADKVLSEIQKLLSSTNTTPEELNKIIVHRVAGSYTGIRVGLTIANTLAFALKIPVNDKKIGEWETAQYK